MVDLYKVERTKSRMLQGQTGKRSNASWLNEKGINYASEYSLERTKGRMKDDISSLINTGCHHSLVWVYKLLGKQVNSRVSRRIT